MKRITLFLGISLLLCASAFAQSQATTGNIEGRLVDQNGAVVTNAAVTATNQDTGFGQTTTTDSDGNYIFVLLPPGKYRVEVSAQGFSKATYENVIVTVGSKRSLEISLSVGGLVNVVDVQSSGEVIETTRTSISSTVDEKRVTNLPTNGRNFLDFATLTPGIIRDPTRSGDLAVGGQKGTLNSLQIDGTSSDNTFFGQSSGRVGSGRAPSQFSVDTVKEFQVNQNGFSAEYGRAAGAVINVVTKSGTNNFSGSAFYFFRDESLNAKNPSFPRTRAKPFGQINQFGGTFGGPIKKDRIFFFGAFEGQRSDLPNPVILNSLPFAPVNVIALLTPKISSYNINRQQNTYLGKVDFNINKSNQVWVRFNQQDFVGTNLESSGPLSAEEHTGNSNVKTQTLTSSWTRTLSSKWFNEFRFQYSRDQEPGLANADIPEVVLTANAGGINDGNFAFGRNNFSPRETTIDRYQFIDNQTYLIGDHSIKYGADILIDRIFNFFPGLFGGSYNFPSYAALSSNTPSRYRQSFAGAGTTGAVTRPNNNEYAFFIQDDWRVRPNLSINLGLRYDYQIIAKPPIQNPNAALLAAGFDTGFQPKDKNNFAPRLGLSYAIDSKSVLRLGYGMFFARTIAIVTSTAQANNGIQVIAIDINCTTSPALCPTYPNVFNAVPTNVAAVTPNLSLFGKDYKQPFTHQVHVQYERAIMKNTTFSAQFTMFRGVDLTRSRNANLTAPVQTPYQIFTSAGVGTGQFLNVSRFSNPLRVAGFTRITLFESTAKSLYKGLTLELNRRFDNSFQFGLSYTLSEALDNKPDQTAVTVGVDDAKIAENQFDLSGEWGRSDLDVRHRFIFSAIYETGTFKFSENKIVRALLSDYFLTGIVTAQSGFAFSAIVSGDPNGDGNTSNDRAPGTLRNGYSTPSTYIFDIRVGRSIRFREKYKVTLLAEGFNIFNRPNVQLVNNTLYAFSTVGGVGRLTQTTNFNTPRQFVSGSPSFTFNSSYNREFQLGLRLDF
jgi:outer membrane receptor protein involved in Fe transport